MGNQAGTIQRHEYEEGEAGTSLSSQIIERATRLHRHYFPLSPQDLPLSTPLTPDTTTPAQVCIIRMYLCQILPEELVNPILDYAEVYTASVNERRERISYQDRQGAVWAIQDRQERERHWIYLVSKPIFGRVLRVPRPLADDHVEGEPNEVLNQATLQEEVEEVPEDPNKRNPWKVKSIEVRTWSSDQGWTSEHFETDDPYDGSYTWFEIAVARGEDILPVTLEIQRNKRADREVQYYEHEIALESPVIQQVRRGDKLVLLAKAQFPGWQNRVEKAELGVYYGF